MHENDRLLREEVLDAPLIRMVMHADGVSRDQLAALMNEVAARHARRS